MAKKTVLFINNPNHIGIWAVGEGYRRALESLGVDFNYLELRSLPKAHNDGLNMTIKAHMCDTRYDIVIMVQPTYMSARTYSYLLNQFGDKKGTAFYAINTEDPYSVHGMLQISGLFTKIFTNEIVCAELFEQARFVYLPLAFNTLQPYRVMEKVFDVAMHCTYYGNRAKYYARLIELENLKKFIGGNISYLAMNDMHVNTMGFTQAPGLVNRHKELEIYSMSKFVLNPHRDPQVVGRSDFMVPQKECKLMVKAAKSPNPRFFDCLGAGAIPLCDESRTECLALISKYIDVGDLKFTLPDHMYLQQLEGLVDRWEEYQNAALTLRTKFMENENYIKRSEYLLQQVEY